MTASRDLDRLIQAFLAEGRTDLPDESFDAVRAGIDRTRQRVLIGPWREPSMSTMYRLAGAAAVVAALVAGLTLITGSSFGPPHASATPTAFPSATGTPTLPAESSTAQLTYTWPGSLAAGTYATSFIWNIPFAIRFTVPAGWTSRDVELINGTDPPILASVAFLVPGNTYTDSCALVERVPATGPSVDDFAAAMATISGIHAKAPRPTVIGGRDAVHVEYSADPSASCPTESRMWNDDLGAHMPLQPQGSPYWPVRPGPHNLIVVDVDGTRLVIDMLVDPTAPPGLGSEVEEIMQSVRFVTPRERVTAGTCALELSDPASGPTLDPEHVSLQMGASTHELRGPVPATPEGQPLTPKPPLAQLDILGSSWAPTGAGAGRPTVLLMPPEGVSKRGFATATVVGGFQGSFVFDAPGTWWVRVVSQAAGCVRQFPVEILPPG